MSMEDTLRCGLMGYAEVAELLGVRPAAVRNRLYEARKARESGDDRPRLIPEPFVVFGSCPLWTTRQVSDWVARRSCPKMMDDLEDDELLGGDWVGRRITRRAGFGARAR